MTGGHYELNVYKNYEGKLQTSVTSIGFTKNEIIDLLAEQLDKMKNVDQHAYTNQCVVCGSVIPEGRYVCKICELKF